MHAKQHSLFHSRWFDSKRTRRLWIVLFLSLTYMVAEIVGAYFSGSLALFADAGHMALDTAALLLGLIAVWISSRPPTLEKTYGYYRAEILIALFNGAMLLAGSFGIFLEAFQRIREPGEIKAELMTAVAGGGLIVNLLSLIVMHRDRSQNLNLRAVWLHLLMDTLGSLSAIIAGVLVWNWGWRIADPIVSILIACLILLGAWRLLVACVNVLLVSVPEGVNVSKIHKDIQSLPQVSEVHDLHVWAISPDISALSAHVRLRNETNQAEVLSTITGLLREKYSIEHTTLQLEPPSFVEEKQHFCKPTDI